MRLSEVNYGILGVFVAMHVIAGCALIRVPFSLELLVLAVAVTAVRWLGFSCAVHRYFSHRVCRTSRWFQFALGIWGTLTMARSPIKFASGHRHHHLYSDSPRDLHSPKHHGVLEAYVGWVISKRYDEARLGHVDDLKRYPELVWLNKLYFLPNLMLLAALYFGGGLDAFAYGGLLSIIFTWHLAFSVTVLFHKVGEPAYDTGDESKNSALLGILMLGEGWHNNHHANPRSARLGHEWWQLDLGYLIFVALEWLGLIWSLNRTTGPAHSGIKRIKLRSAPSAVDVIVRPVATDMAGGAAHS